MIIVIIVTHGISCKEKSEISVSASVSACQRMGSMRVWAPRALQVCEFVLARLDASELRLRRVRYRWIRIFEAHLLELINIFNKFVLK